MPVLPLLPSEDRPLAERFAVPPASTRILRIIHSQRDDPGQQDQQLQKLAAQGFGGFAGNVAFNGYVDDETKWPAFLRGVRMAKAAGMSLWLYDECGYPSGSARDLTLQGHPEWAARGLLVAETTTSGGPVSLAVPPGQLVLAAALPRRDGVIVLDEAKDLSEFIKGSEFSWQAPPGVWFVVVMTDDLIYEGTHAAISLAYKKPCIDLLTPEPTARFLEVTHARYAEKLGNDLGWYFVSTFTDEPSLQNLWFRPMPYRVLPWSLTIEREFRKRRGRELRPLLPALVTDAGPAGARARYEFWNTVGELVSENYFGQIEAWCHEHNILSGGHLLMEESLVGHVPLYGHFFRCVRRLDAPSIDCLTSLPPQVPWYVARMIGSIADLEGSTVTMCEVSDHSQRYRREGDTRPVRIVTEDEIRGTCNRLAWGGINTLTSYYAFKDLTEGAVAAHERACRPLPDHVARWTSGYGYRRALSRRKRLAGVCSRATRRHGRTGCSTHRKCFRRSEFGTVRCKSRFRLRRFAGALRSEGRGRRADTWRPALARAGFTCRRYLANKSLGKRGRVLAPRRCGDRRRNSPPQ